MSSTILESTQERRTEANGRGGGAMSVMSVGWGRKATVGEPEKDKIVLSLGRVNIPIFAGYSLCPFCPFWSLF